MRLLAFGTKARACGRNRRGRADEEGAPVGRRKEAPLRSGWRAFGAIAAARPGRDDGGRAGGAILPGDASGALAASCPGAEARDWTAEPPRGLGAGLGILSSLSCKWNVILF